MRSLPENGLGGPSWYRCVLPSRLTADFVLKLAAVWNRRGEFNYNGSWLTVG